ncbi:MAG: prepilin-type N-terminal cleavage/methylation domain-containing protein [Candidatus Zixiibacteriota bacterium]
MVNFRDKLRRVVARVRETIRPSSSGFTFIEVVMVIVIIGIIAAVATSSL